MKNPYSLLFLAFLTTLIVNATDDLSPLSDEFDRASSVTNFSRIFQVEGWGANQLQAFDINTTRPGAMFMMPYTSTWYQDYRGELTFKLVSGDFVVTTDVTPTSRAGTGAPRSPYSLAGIMVRTPRAITNGPAQWTPGGENYVFLSLGSANSSGVYQYEVKTTLNSSSTLIISNGVSRGTIQVAKIGPFVITLKQDQGGSWTVHRRFLRSDMPGTLQVGLTVYTDFATASHYTPLVHNQTVLTNGNPDLLAAFDYLRFQRPVVPPNLAGANLADPNVVSDAQLLSFLGANANPVPGDSVTPAITAQPQSQTVIAGTNVTFTVAASGGGPLSYQWLKDTIAIAGATNSVLVLPVVALSDSGSYTVAVSNSAGSVTSDPALLTVQMASGGGTTINVSSVVRNPAMKRLGLNLGWANFFDSGQIMKELIFQNPSFEGLIYQSIIHVASGSSTSCFDDYPTGRWTNGFWNGASYESIYGLSKGRTGLVVSSSAPSGTNGGSYQFSNSGTAFAAGDYVLFRKSERSGVETGWNPQASGGGVVTNETADLPPDTLGRQAIRVSATGTGQNASITAAFETSINGSFLQMNGNFHLTFKAKGVGGPNTLNITFGRAAPANISYIRTNITLTGNWDTYTVNFSATENGAAAGPCPLRFAPINQSAILLDDVSLTQIDGDPANTTAFRDPVVKAIKGFNPGILRYWVENLGNTLDNDIAPVGARQRAGYGIRGQSAQLLYGLHEFLELCELVGTEPWYIVPIVFSPQEAVNLLEYLAGPTNTVYGARRAARGHPAPWTISFARIHLEFGNESWNLASYNGGAMQDSVAYGTRGNEIFGAIKTSPYFNLGQFDLVLGGQASFVGRTLAIHNACTNHTTLAVAPYFSGTVDNFANNEELYGPLFAEPEIVNTVGYMHRNLTNMQNSTHPVAIGVYEINLTTVLGSISQSVLDSYTPSLGAGLAVADDMLMLARDLGVKDQVLYGLTQYANGRTDGKHVLLWGCVRDMGVTDRKRPQYLAVKLANEAIRGDLVQTIHNGDNPTWNQVPSNGVDAYPNAHYLRSYAFNSPTGKAVIVFNLHRTSALNVNFTGPNAPSSPVTMKRLTSANLTDTNESTNNVVTTTNVLGNFDPSGWMALPPYSMTVLQWGGVSDTPPAITIQPQGQALTSGASVILNVTASGTPPLTYQWQKNGANLAGTTNSMLVLSNVNRAFSGSYSVNVANNAGDVTSAAALIRVLTPQRLNIPGMPHSGPLLIQFGDSDNGLLSASDLTNFEVQVTDNLPATQWLKVLSPLVLTNGQILMNDSDAAGRPRRFYRVIENP